MRKLTPVELAERRSAKIEIKQRNKIPIYGMLDNVRSLNNVGSIFRTADGAGIRKLYLCGITGSPPREEIRKTSLGAEESMDWEYRKNAVDVLQKLKSENIHIIVLEHTDCSVHYKRAHYTFPACLIVGHEHKGVSQEIIDLADVAIEIPMYGVKQSLNVAVAFGIAMYELIDQCQNYAVQQGNS